MRKPVISRIVLIGCLAVAWEVQNTLLVDDSRPQAAEQATEPLETSSGAYEEQQKERAQSEKRTAAKETELPGAQTSSLRKGDKAKKDKFAAYPEQVKTNYHCILKNIRATNEDYVGRARQVSSSLENSIRKYGLREIVNMRDRTHNSRLDLALERLGRKMTQKEFDRRAEGISRQYYDAIQKANVSAPIDFTREAVIQAGRSNVIVDVVFYEKLLNSNPQGLETHLGYKELVRSAYSQKEYSELLSKRLSTIDGIYDALLQSRVGLAGLFAASQINQMRDFVKKYVETQVDELYPPKARETPLKKGDNPPPG